MTTPLKKAVTVIRKQEVNDNVEEIQNLCLCVSERKRQWNIHVGSLDLPIKIGNPEMPPEWRGCILYWGKEVHIVIAHQTKKLKQIQWKSDTNTEATDLTFLAPDRHSLHPPLPSLSFRHRPQPAPIPPAPKQETQLQNACKNSIDSNLTLPPHHSATTINCNIFWRRNCDELPKLKLPVFAIWKEQQQLVYATPHKHGTAHRKRLIVTAQGLLVLLLTTAAPSTARCGAAQFAAPFNRSNNRWKMEELIFAKWWSVIKWCGVWHYGSRPKLGRSSFVSTPSIYLEAIFCFIFIWFIIEIFFWSVDNQILVSKLWHFVGAHWSRPK